MVSATFGESDSGLTAARTLFLIGNRLPMLLLRLLSRSKRMPAPQWEAI